MQIIQIELLNEKALPLLRDLEDLEVIRILPPDAPKQKLSEQFRGSISAETAEKMHQFIKNSVGSRHEFAPLHPTRLLRF